MRNIFGIILTLSLFGCNRELLINKKCDSPSECIDPIVNYINQHVDGVNQLNTDEHARFNSNDTTLIIYIGKSEEDFFKKWILPLNMIDPEQIAMNPTLYSGNPLTVTLIDAECVFEFYENNSFKKNTCQWNYYPGATNGSKRRFRHQFVSTFKKAVKLSRSAPWHML